LTRAGRTLSAGSYRLDLTVTDVNHVTSDPRSVRFTIPS
jgi:hypothetical protein